jgi:hypothetical protein
MPVSASTATRAFRTERYQLSRDLVMSHVWKAIRGRWQSARERAVARAVLELDHAGVSEDYRTARRGNNR